MHIEAMKDIWHFDHFVLYVVNVTKPALVLNSFNHLTKTFRHVSLLVKILHVTMSHTCFGNELMRRLNHLQIFTHFVLYLDILIITLCERFDPISNFLFGPTVTRCST